MKYIFTIALMLLAFTCFPQIPDNYYDTAEGLSGDELKAALHNIIDDHTTYPYTSTSTDVWDILKESDRDPNNADNVILIYTGWSVNAAQEYNNANGWTREHIWAKSHGDFDINPPAGTDAHHLRPCDDGVNSSRSDKDFDIGGTRHSVATECYSTSDTWEPRDAVKGDIARMMFYMAVRYEGDVSGEPDLELVDHITSYPDPVFGVLSTLLKWNSEDPVDDFERNRNEVVYSYQHNRNPFIDHPEYVNLVFNVTNHAPVIENQEFSVAENSITGTEAGTIEAVDPDYNEISFSILSGNTDNAFLIGASTGLLSVNNTDALNYETNPVFNLNVQVSDGSLTSVAIITVIIENTTGINPIAFNSDVKIYPNPVSGILFLTKPDNYSIEIFSIIGEKLITTTDKQINVHQLERGIYFAVIKDEFGNILKSQKIFKE